MGNGTPPVSRDDRTPVQLRWEGSATLPGGIAGLLRRYGGDRRAVVVIDEAVGCSGGDVDGPVRLGDGWVVSRRSSPDHRRGFR